MNKKRFTYRLSNILYQLILEESKKKNISVNAVINSILWNYFENYNK